MRQWSASGDNHETLNAVDAAGCASVATNIINNQGTDESLVSALRAKIKLKIESASNSTDNAKLFDILQKAKIIILRNESNMEALLICVCGAKISVKYKKHLKGDGGYWKSWNFERHFQSHLRAIDTLLHPNEGMNTHFMSVRLCTTKSRK